MGAARPLVRRACDAGLSEYGELSSVFLCPVSDRRFSRTGGEDDRRGDARGIAGDDGYGCGGRRGGGNRLRRRRGSVDFHDLNFAHVAFADRIVLAGWIPSGL